MLSERGQRKTNTVSFTCMIQEAKQTNSKRETDSHYRKIVATSGGEKEGRGKVGLKDTNYYVQTEKQQGYIV